MHILLILCVILGLSVPHIGYGKVVGTFRSEGMDLLVEEVAADLEIPWGFDFPSKSKLIFSERKGGLQQLDLDTRKLTSIKNVPETSAGGQGGFLDVSLHPNFLKNRWVYFSYVVKPGKGKTTRIARAKLIGDELKSFEVLFTAKPYYTTSHHFGSRIVFDDSGFIYFSIGDRGKRDGAQELDRHNGKIIRLHEDGRTPKDNPFVSVKNALPEIWTYGHRNPQGLVWNPATKTLWESEHGPRGGDEINLIQKGLNYGWPVITFGREYYGPKIGAGITEKKGMEQPVKQYTPSIAPCGMALYTGQKFPKWKDNLFLGSLAYEHVNRIVLKGFKVIKEERLFESLKERIRNVRMGPDEYLYFSTDSGQILRVVPANKP